MALTLEWRQRIDTWRRELPSHFTRHLGEVPLEFFATTKQLAASEALAAEFLPTSPGAHWGAKWEYGWFKGELELPTDAAGRRIVLSVDVGAESAIWINGSLAGASDRRHPHITLCAQGEPGTRYAVLAEGYAGHGPRVSSGGPVPPGRQTVPEPGPTQATVGASTFAIWEEEAYQLWIDVETLYNIRDHIDANSLRVAEIDQGLRNFTLIVDFELPRSEMMDSVAECRDRLRPLLACTNGSTAPTLFAFGHAHIDVAWLWPLAETERKCARTFSTQLSLLDEYPEYRFLQSQPHLYQMVQRRYPELYRRIKRAVEAGQFIVDGGTWVEPDTNITGGESMIRQFIHGKRFFLEEFGVDCQVLWLPDVFGYSGALPQIMRGCGIKYFSTQKIFWAYKGGAPFPYNTFIWEGIDGSEVLAHLHNDYNARTDPASLIQRWNERVQKDGISTRLYPFGWGDGGGGPTRDHLEFLRREADLEGVPYVTTAAPLEFFEDLEARGLPDARYVGELYLPVHRGTYTSQAKTKQGNRRSEFALREAEMWGVAARALCAYEYPVGAMDEAWKKVLLNQFHDILPGSSIQRVHEEAEASYADVIETSREVIRQATSCVTDDSSAVTLFNSLSWNRSAVVPLPQGFSGAIDEAGQQLPSQRVGDVVCVETTLPPCGWTALRDARPVEPPNTMTATERLLENDVIRLEFNSRGEITSILDRSTGREFAAGSCNSFGLYRDIPTNWDAWDIDSVYPLSPVALAEEASVEVLAEGPLIAKIRVSRMLNLSRISQEIVIRRGSTCVEFRTTIDWQESHKLLKVAFPVDLHANHAIHEIQFGHIQRPNHRSRPYDADRYEVCNHKWTALAEQNRGFAVLNDCKYGVSVLGNSIQLTLLKSALAPDMFADKGRQEFTYACTLWNGSLAASPVVREAYELNCPVAAASGRAAERSLFAVDAANVIIETVKPAEDASDDVVVRLFEAMRTATRCTLATTLPVAHAWKTNMLEEAEEQLACVDGRILLDLRAFEVRTVRLRLAPA